MREKFDTKKDWLNARKGKITSTKTAAILGVSPYMTNVEAYEYITGVKEENTKENERMMKGSKAEEHIRQLWALAHDEYEVESNSLDSWDLWTSKKYPYIAASGDGKITNKLSGKWGLLEIKRVQVDSKKTSDMYKDTIPQHYYVQVIQEMYCSNADFIVFIVCLVYNDGEQVIKDFMINKEDVQEDLHYVEQEVVNFYNKYVLPKKRPPMKLNF